MKNLSLRKLQSTRKWWSEDSNPYSLTPNHRVREDRKIFKWSTRHMIAMGYSPES